jgi:hypothetical protein
MSVIRDRRDASWSRRAGAEISDSSRFSRTAKRKPVTRVNDVQLRCLCTVVTRVYRARAQASHPHSISGITSLSSSSSHSRAYNGITQRPSLLAHTRLAAERIHHPHLFKTDSSVLHAWMCQRWRADDLTRRSHGHQTPGIVVVLEAGGDLGQAQRAPKAERASAAAVCSFSTTVHSCSRSVSWLAPAPC